MYERIINNDISAPEGMQRQDRKEPGISGPRPDQPNAAGIEIGEQKRSVCEEVGRRMYWRSRGWSAELLNVRSTGGSNWFIPS